MLPEEMRALRAGETVTVGTYGWAQARAESDKSDAEETVPTYEVKEQIDEK